MKNDNYSKAFGPRWTAKELNDEIHDRLVLMDAYGALATHRNQHANLQGLG
jgi:hypothetical protein